MKHPLHILSKRRLGTIKGFRPRFDNETPTPPETPKVDPPKNEDDPSKLKEALKNALEDYKSLQTVAQLNSKEKEEYAKRYKDLEATLLTKEELAAREREELANRLTGELDSHKQRGDKYEKLFRTSTIKRDLTSAASAAEAINPNQIEALLEPHTDLEEIVAGEKPTGNYRTIVNFPSTKDGQPVTLKLSVSDAVKFLKESKENRNLFRGKGVPGIGGDQEDKADTDIVKVANGDPAAYRAARKDGTVKLD